MPLQKDIPELLEHLQNQTQLLEHNTQLFETNEGELLKFLENDLREQLGEDSFNSMRSRIAPINILRKIVKKLSKIYSEAPERSPVIESASDEGLLEFYSNSMRSDTIMNCSNEFSNLFNNTALEPYLDRGVPRLRTIPSHRFTVYSKDQDDPTRPTHFIKFMGERLKPNGEGEMEKVFFIYTDDEWRPINALGQTLFDLMRTNPQGINPFGRIPFVYINNSMHQLIPLRDSDMLRMTKVIPILLSDLHYASLFQSFSIIYGIDVDVQNLKMAPNAFWKISSKATGNAPSLDTLKPTVDFDKVINMIRFDLGFWMETRNIRPGESIRQSSDASLSGVALMIQNMDTTEERKRQIPIFEAAEKDLWQLISKHMHPLWSRSGAVEERRQFSANFDVNVTYVEPKVALSFDQRIKEQEQLLKNGLTTKRMAVEQLYPRWTAEQVDEHLANIKEEESIDFTNVLPMSSENAG